jgi:predicted homoserine dehydrogenase-like protein
MIYRQLFNKLAAGHTVAVGVIGTGQYATAVVAQSGHIPELRVSVVCDLDVDAAIGAFERAGMTDYVVCESLAEAQQAIESGRRAIVQDVDHLLALPVDVVVESTGIAEAAAKHAAAIDAGKHVAMVSKEADATVGPILKRRADDAGLVYSAVDGDQHGLLIGLVLWARDVGLDVLCGGKALASDLVYDPDADTVSSGGRRAVDVADPSLFAPSPPANAPALVGVRRQALGGLGAIQGYDITEMTIVANATGLAPDTDELRCPVLRIPEIPQVLCPQEMGGILTRRGVADCVTCLRGPYEAGLGGGVFVVVSCENDYSRHILTSKGLISNSSDTAALVYRAYHLCGVETPMTLLTIGLLGAATGAVEYMPRYDIVARAREDMRAGEVVGSDHSPRLRAMMRPALPAMSGNPIPLHMASGHRLACDVPAGALLLMEMVEAPVASTLWNLRREQDTRLLG